MMILDMESPGSIYGKEVAQSLTAALGISHTPRQPLDFVSLLDY